MVRPNFRELEPDRGPAQAFGRLANGRMTDDVFSAVLTVWASAFNARTMSVFMSFPFYNRRPAAVPLPTLLPGSVLLGREGESSPPSR
jgi:hypothetical protein